MSYSIHVLDPRLLTIDEISGIFDHGVQCQELIKMSRNPHIPLHPDMREYALSLLRQNILLTQLQHKYVP